VRTVVRCPATPIDLNQEKEKERCRGEVKREVKAEMQNGHCPVAGGFPWWADSLELKNGSLIKGKFIGGTESEISFQVGSSVQKYNLADIASLKFDSERPASDLPVSQPVVPDSQLRIRWCPTFLSRESWMNHAHSPLAPAR
jgi:hypothetical protein